MNTFGILFKKYAPILLTLIFLISFNIRAQEKIKFSFNGVDKIEYKTNNIGDLLMNYLSNNSASDNLFIGQNTGTSIFHSSNLEGYYNTAIGNFSFTNNSTGHSNVAFGRSAMISNTIGSSNSAIGTQSLFRNTIGSYNTAIGHNALFSNLARNRNTAIGYQAMMNASNTSTAEDGYNTAIGYEALKGSDDPASNTGQRNTAVGNSALIVNTEGSSNTAVGDEALKSNTEGSYNVSMGPSSLSANLTGNYNAGIGFYALGKNTSGSNNIAIGQTALYENTDGSFNVTLGHNAMYANQSGSNNVAIGSSAGINNKGNGNVFIGNKAGELEGGTSSNKLFIDNSGKADDQALIYGEFDNQYLRMNSHVEAYSSSASKAAISGIQDYDPSISSNQSGVYGENLVRDGNGIGVTGKGGFQGIRGESFSSNGNSYGVGGNALTFNSASNYGVYGVANSGTANYSIFGDFPGFGVDDWAGYFNGKIYSEKMVHTAGVTFNENTSNSGAGNQIEHAVQIKYIICTNGVYPSSDDGNTSTGQFTDALLGEVKMFAGHYPPDGWKFCDGSLLSVIDYQSLFSLLSTKYGGDGTNNFGLPNLTNAVPIHYSGISPNH